MNSNSWILGSVTKLHGLSVTRRRVSVLADCIAPTIPRNHTVLDVGCGSGLLASEIIRRRSDVCVQGLDVRVHEHTSIPVSQYDGTSIPWDDDSWDVVMAIDVLHHCTDPLATLKEMCRVSRSLVVIKDHMSENWADYQLLKFMDWVGNRGYGTVLPYNYYSGSEWTKAFGSANLLAQEFKTDLKIYPLPFRWLFDRKLHFLVVLAKDIR